MGQPTGKRDRQNEPLRVIAPIHTSACRRFLVGRVGRRGAALVFFALLDFVYAFSLADPQPEARRSSTFRYVASIFPLWVWSVLWAIAGLACLISAFRTKDKIGFTAAIAIKTLWGFIFVVAAITGGVDRAYVGATLWLCLAAWVAIISAWPEPPQLQHSLRNRDPRT